MPAPDLQRSLRELAQQRRLPAHQPMDPATLAWIESNRPVDFHTAPSFPRPGQMLVPSASWFTDEQQAESNHGIRHNARASLYASSAGRGVPAGRRRRGGGVRPVRSTTAGTATTGPIRAMADGPPHGSTATPTQSPVLSGTRCRRPRRTERLSRSHCTTSPTTTSPPPRNAPTAPHRTSWTCSKPRTAWTATAFPSNAGGRTSPSCASPCLPGWLRPPSPSSWPASGPGSTAPPPPTHSPPPTRCSPAARRRREHGQRPRRRAHRPHQPAGAAAGHAQRARAHPGPGLVGAVRWNGVQRLVSPQGSGTAAVRDECRGGVPGAGRWSVCWTTWTSSLDQACDHTGPGVVAWMRSLLGSRI